MPVKVEQYHHHLVVTLHLALLASLSKACTPILQLMINCTALAWGWPRQHHVSSGLGHWSLRGMHCLRSPLCRRSRRLLWSELLRLLQQHS